MDRKIQLLDVVALIVDLPDRGLVRGQVGTVVESLGANACEVDFSDDQGRTYAQFTVPARQLMILHHHPVRAA